jgi:hypothetical protein
MALLFCADRIGRITTWCDLSQIVILAVDRFQKRMRSSACRPISVMFSPSAVLPMSALMFPTLLFVATFVAVGDLMLDATLSTGSMGP